MLGNPTDQLEELDAAIKQVARELRDRPELKKLYGNVVNEARDALYEARTFSRARNYPDGSWKAFVNADYVRIAQKTYDTYWPQLERISILAKQPKPQLLKDFTYSFVNKPDPGPEPAPYYVQGAKDLADSMTTFFGDAWNSDTSDIPDEGNMGIREYQPGTTATDATTPAPGRVSAWLKPDEVKGFVDIIGKGFDFYQKQQLQTELLRIQAQGTPIQAPPKIIYRAKQAATPWGVIALVALGVVGVGAIVYSSGRRSPAPVTGLALARI